MKTCHASDGNPKDPRPGTLTPACALIVGVPSLLSNRTRIADWAVVKAFLVLVQMRWVGVFLSRDRPAMVPQGITDTEFRSFNVQ